MHPIVGIPACAILMVKEQLRHDTPARYPAAVLGGAGAVPILDRKSTRLNSSHRR